MNSHELQVLREIKEMYTNDTLLALLAEENSTMEHLYLMKKRGEKSDKLEKKIIEFLNEEIERRLI